MLDVIQLLLPSNPFKELSVEVQFPISSLSMSGLYLSQVLPHQDISTELSRLFTES